MIEVNKDYIENNHSKFDPAIDYVLMDETCLFHSDWNGEAYRTGCKHNITTGAYYMDFKEYKPVYNENKEVVGFEIL